MVEGNGPHVAPAVEAQDRVVAAGPGRLALIGEFDAFNAHEIEASVESLGGGEVVVDCSRVLYMDSSALHVLVRVARRGSSDGGGRLIIESPSPFVRRILDVSGIARGAGIIVRDEPDPEILTAETSRAGTDP